MRTFFSALALCLLLGAGFFYALTTTLGDMTKRDCQAGVAKACLQLQKAGVQV